MRARAAAASAAVLVSACSSPSVNILQVTVEAYISAVSLGDVSRVMSLSAPCQKDLMAAGSPERVRAIEKEYRGRIESGSMLWDQAKAAGQLSLDPLGITLILGVGLGKEGAAAMPLGTRFEPDGSRAVVTTRAITNYEGIAWDSIPMGGRMYLLGVPFGKVVNFATGYDDPSTLQLLATVDLRWTLVTIPGLERPAGAPGDWYIEKVEPLPETATSWSPRPAAQ